MIRAISLDYWGTIADPNPLYSRARTSYFAGLFGVEPEIAHAKYKRIKTYCDLAAERSGSSYQPITAIRMLLHGENTKRRVDAVDVYHDLMFLVSKFPPIVSLEMSRVLQCAALSFDLAITSNTNFIPGNQLRNTLPLGRVFRVMTFSDEIGACKPATEIFNFTYRGLVLHNKSLDKSDVLHIGDNIKCDGGATRFGLKAKIVADTSQTIEALNELIERKNNARNKSRAS